MISILAVLADRDDCQRVYNGPENISILAVLADRDSPELLDAGARIISILAVLADRDPRNTTEMAMPIFQSSRSLRTATSI